MACSFTDEIEDFRPGFAQRNPCALDGVDVLRQLRKLQDLIHEERVCRRSEIAFLWDEVLRLRQGRGSQTHEASRKHARVQGHHLSDRAVEGDPMLFDSWDREKSEGLHTVQKAPSVAGICEPDRTVEKESFLFDSWDVEEPGSQSQRLWDKLDADRKSLESKIAVADRRAHEMEENVDELFKTFALVEHMVAEVERRVKAQDAAEKDHFTEVCPSAHSSVSTESTTECTVGRPSTVSLSSSLLSRLSRFKPKSQILEGSQTLGLVRRL